MKKDLGSLLALYPMPLVVMGTMVKGKANWVLAGHVGIMGHGQSGKSALYQPGNP